MVIAIPSFAKINLGLRIGALRDDGFHELRTVYQTIALHDVIRVSVERGAGIEIRCDNPRVPKDSSNTCFRIVDLAMQALKAKGRVVVEIEKRLPVQGGLGGASGNAVAALIALEKALRKGLAGAERFKIAAEVGSDVPLFLIGGTVLGLGRGEEVYPAQDLAAVACVVAMPGVAVSTPKAFRDWDGLVRAYPPIMDGEGDGIGQERLAELRSAGTGEGARPHTGDAYNASSYNSSNSSSADCGSSRYSKLTGLGRSDRMIEFSREISAWLSAGPGKMGRRRSGVSASRGGRAENLLLDLVRTGIENDFEKVVFPQFPELREVKSVLERAGARYASLSGSGSAVYGLFASRQKAVAAAKKLAQAGTPAMVTSTLTRLQYWKKLLALSS